VDRSIGAVAKAGLDMLRLRVPLKEFDALVVVCEGLGDLIVFRNSGQPTICVCLTPLRLVFDSEYRARTLNGRSWISRMVIATGSAVFRHLDRLAWKRYRQVFCISEEAKRRALAGKLAAQSEPEILHVGLGFEPQAPSEEFDRFFLLPGRIMWTKNIELGIEAFQRFRSNLLDARGFRLVIAGLVDQKSKPYLEKLRQLAAGDPNVEFRIFPTDDELAALYSRCYGVLFTSFNEDWGIVPLEAMAFGKPVIAVDQGGPRETVLHEINGFLEKPEPDAFAGRMRQLAADPSLAIRMGRQGRTHSNGFSWGTFTDRIDRAIDSLPVGMNRADSRTESNPASPGPSCLEVTHSGNGRT
jgi:glycosyltransferase involved in cell wall biosynthesis